MSNTKKTKRNKARDIHIVRRAALHLLFPNCPLCGNANTGESFNMPSRKTGIDRLVTGEAAETHYCHIEAASKGGAWSDDNFFVGHALCNRMQSDSDLEWYCDNFNTSESAAIIREKALQAKKMADEMMAGTM